MSARRPFRWCITALRFATRLSRHVVREAPVKDDAAIGGCTEVHDTLPIAGQRPAPGAPAKETARRFIRMETTFTVGERGACAEALRYNTRASGARVIRQLTKVGRGLGKLPRGPRRACQWDGRIKLLKTLHFKSFCPTQACTTPAGTSPLQSTPWVHCRHPGCIATTQRT